MTVLRAVLLFLAFGGVLMAAVQGSSALSLEEKIPMLFMVADYGDEPLAIQEKAGKNLGEVTARVDRLVAEKKIGGILFKGRWTPAGLKERIRHLLSLSSMPLLLAQDLEWGLAMRHDGAVELPKALCMGAISDPVLLEAWGHAIARTAGSIGINLFLGPVADVNSNPKNPVIHDRSFGDNCNEVARRVCSVVRVIQQDGLASCVKHFPGHGNTSKDSHTHLPVIDATMIQLRSQELVPFKAAIDGGVDCVMSAHILLPHACSDNAPASLSSFWCQKVLRDELGFQGVLISDDLIMAGASDGCTCEETAVRAVRAGNDLCIVSRDVELCFDAVLKAVQSGDIQEKEIDDHVRRVSHLQKRASFHKPAPSLFSVMALHKELYRQALTSVGEPFCFSPETMGILPVGDVSLSPLIRDLVQSFPSASVEALRRIPRKEEIDGVLRAMENKQELLVVLCDLERSPALSFGISPELLRALQAMQEKGKTIRYVIFGSPYVLSLLPKPITSALVAYERTSGAELAVLQALCGTLTPKGALPVKV